MSGQAPLRSEEVLLRDACRHAAQEHEGRNRLVADIAEIDARKAYRPAGYDSMLSYCVHELRLTEKAALHRIHVGRVAWRFSSVLRALDDGRLHVSSVAMLATYLTQENAEELVEAASHKTRVELEQLIAERFPRQDLFRPSTTASEERVLGFEVPSESTQELAPQAPCASEPMSQRPPGGVQSCPRTPDVVHEERFLLKVGLKRATHEKLRRAQELLGHEVPSGDAAEILDRALDELLRKLEQRKFASTAHPRRSRTWASGEGHRVPAEVKRAVWGRDGGQCTFVGTNGQRCPARKMLEFDHIEPIARGGSSSTSNVRLLCRAHNQYVAEQALGEAFMRSKREQAQQEAEARAVKNQRLEEVKRSMQRLGFTVDESRRAAAHAVNLAGDSLEARVRAALAYLVPSRRREANVPIPGSTIALT